MFDVSPVPGRIGRIVLRNALLDERIDVVAVNECVLSASRLLYNMFSSYHLRSVSTARSSIHSTWYGACLSPYL